MCSNIYDDITNFEGFGFINTKQKIKIYLERNIFLSKDKIHSLYIRGYNMVKKLFYSESNI